MFLPAVFRSGYYSGVWLTTGPPFLLSVENEQKPLLKSTDKVTPNYI